MQIVKLGREPLPLQVKRAFTDDMASAAKIGGEVSIPCEPAFDESFLNLALNCDR